MKVKELINKLQEILDKNGNIETEICMNIRTSNYDEDKNAWHNIISTNEIKVIDYTEETCRIINTNEISIVD